MTINKEIIIRSGIFRPIKFTNGSGLKRRSDLGQDILEGHYTEQLLTTGYLLNNEKKQV